MSKRIDSNRILVAAILVAEDVGYVNITRDAISIKAGVSAGTVSQTFGTMVQLKRAVMRHAVKNELLGIIADGILLRDKTAQKISPELKTKVLQFI